MNKNICWHTPEVVNEMNRFYDAHKNNAEVNEHFKVFAQLLFACGNSSSHSYTVLDLGCGTAMLREYCKKYFYMGADLPHIIEGCAKRNYPGFSFIECNIEEDELSWIRKYKIISLNAIIDIMENPLTMLGKILSCAKKYVIIHRQEITEEGKTHSIKKPAYNSFTFHSIINRKDFNKAVAENNFEIIKELPLPFADWENGGASFLLKRYE